MPGAETPQGPLTGGVQIEEVGEGVVRSRGRFVGGQEAGVDPVVVEAGSGEDEVLDTIAVVWAPVQGGATGCHLVSGGLGGNVVANDQRPV